MRSVLLASTLVLATLGTIVGSSVASAGPRSTQEETTGAITPAGLPGFERYRGFAFDLSESADRKDATAMADALRSQLDVVENAGLSPKVRAFFHSVPIIANEMACLEEGAAAACYGRALPERDGSMVRGVTVWDSETHKWTNPDVLGLAVDSGIGVIMLRPNMVRFEKEPVLLHEFLHAYHGKLMPHGFENTGIKKFYSDAQAKNLFPKEAYVLKNNKEFFAVTASIFLTGKDAVHEPFTRAKLKEAMPDYYKYLVGVFGFDPEETVAPVASVN